MCSYTYTCTNACIDTKPRRQNPSAYDGGDEDRHRNTWPNSGAYESDVSEMDMRLQGGPTMK